MGKLNKDLFEILQQIAEYGPPNGEKQDGIACAFCDMGDAGYSSRGDGFHDDSCAVKDAQEWLKVNTGFMREYQNMKQQLSGERFWIGHFSDLLGSEINGYAVRQRDYLLTHWPHHTEVIVLQTKKRDDL